MTDADFPIGTLVEVSVECALCDQFDGFDDYYEPYPDDHVARGIVVELPQRSWDDYRPHYTVRLEQPIDCADCAERDARDEVSRVFRYAGHGDMRAVSAITLLGEIET